MDWNWVNTAINAGVFVTPLAFQLWRAHRTNKARLDTLIAQQTVFLGRLNHHDECLDKLRKEVRRSIRRAHDQQARDRTA